MKFAWLILAAATLIGCAPLAPRTAQATDEVIVDQARMAATERAARAAGVQLVWINAPRKSGG